MRRQLYMHLSRDVGIAVGVNGWCGINRKPSTPPPPSHGVTSSSLGGHRLQFSIPGSSMSVPKKIYMSYIHVKFSLPPAEDDSNVPMMDERPVTVNIHGTVYNDCRPCRPDILQPTYSAVCPGAYIQDRTIPSDCST